VGFSNKRTARVGELIMEEMANILLYGEVNDPRLKNIVITGVKMSDDLSHAKIYFTNLNKDMSIQDIMLGFDKAKGFIKRILSKKLRLRKFPELSFKYDESLEKGYRVDQLIKDSVNEHD
jgi:ribosome-binding factor A